MPKYIVKQSIGRYRPGEEIKGLEAKQLQALLASDAIEEYQEPEVIQGNASSDHIAELEKANADLAQLNSDIKVEKEKAEQSVIDLTAKNAELEKALFDAQATLKKSLADAKKATPPTEK
ncbi:hypothetical protein [Acinetobacter sp. ANC 4648]|uniref:hypothetical protein n=1 Tax=Acinetobacter sp. ANC 4648 TaxID=1977875 RepID=UPI000A3358CB|nr:hypothetical protein [Acinetobacter sp. ANC 4648]OTG79405.1 hypothetical protein B9T27_14505 [Acinetobacter sp. ANC 4648]